jgi:hypothetical protein
MIPLGVKTCRKSEFDIFETKKRFPDSEIACVLKRKVTKIAFLKFFETKLTPYFLAYTPRLMPKPATITPCCMDTLAPGTCKALLNRDPEKFYNSCRQDPDFSFMQCNFKKFHLNFMGLCCFRLF